MSKLLTQDEIDALLSQETAPDKNQKSASIQAEKEYRLYDFRRPERVSKDQQRFLRNIHENFAKLLSTYLSNSLRSMIDVKSPIIDQVTYLEFTMSSAEFTNMFLFEIENLEGKAILEIDPNLTTFVIDRLFGGTGSVINRANQITIIESSVITNIAKHILGLLEDAWKNISPLKSTIVDFENNPQLVTIAPSSETMLILNFPIVARNYDFYVYFCFPYFMMEPILKKLISQNYITMLKKKISPEEKELIEYKLIHSKVELNVKLGETSITVEEFLALEPGNILTLNQRVDELVIAEVNGIKKFLGTIGKKRKNYGYKINYFINDQGDIINGTEQ